MEEENYDKIISECSKEIDAQGKYMAEALLLRATFYLLIGNANAAKPDLDKVISLKEANVKVHLKVLCVCVCVHKNKNETSKICFARFFSFQLPFSKRLLLLWKKLHLMVTELVQ